MTKKQNRQMVLELIRYLQLQGLFTYDVNLYFNNTRYGIPRRNDSDLVKKTRYGHYYITDNIDVSHYTKYFNPETITITFEGPLYDALNYGNGSVNADIKSIAGKYGLYPEQGDAWNLSFYEN